MAPNTPSASASGRIDWSACAWICDATWKSVKKRWVEFHRRSTAADVGRAPAQLHAQVHQDVAVGATDRVRAGVATM